MRLTWLHFLKMLQKRLGSSLSGFCSWDGYVPSSSGSRPTDPLQARYTASSMESVLGLTGWPIANRIWGMSQQLNLLSISHQNYLQRQSSSGERCEHCGSLSQTNGSWAQMPKVSSYGYSLNSSTI